LAGAAFAEHISRDGLLISGLVAMAILKQNLFALSRHVGTGKVDEETLVKIDRGVRARPAHGIDWVRVMRMEKVCFGHDFRRLVESADPVKSASEFCAGDVKDNQELIAFLKETDQEKMRAALRQTQEEYSRTMDEMIGAFAIAYADSTTQVAKLEQGTAHMTPMNRLFVPALTQANQRRAEAAVVRAGLLGQVALLRHRLRAQADAASLEGLDVPADPYTGKPFEFAATPEGIELRSVGLDDEGKPRVFRVAK
jgi:hypothetical protein